MSDPTTPLPPEQNPQTGPEFPPGKVKHFIKELLSSKPVRLIIKRPGGNQEFFIVPFEDIGDDTGAFSTEDAQVITILRGIAKQRLMGIREVNAEELERTKKASGVNGKRRASLKPSPLLAGIRRDTAHEGNVVADKGTGFPDPVDTESFISGQSDQLVIPPTADRPPKARRSKKAPTP